MSERLLHDIRKDSGQTVRLLQTINTNILALHEQLVNIVGELKPIRKELGREVDLDKLVTDSKKIAEAGKIFEQYQAGGEIPKKKWWVTQRVVVSDPDNALVGYQGEVTSVSSKEGLMVILDDRTNALFFGVQELMPLPEIKLPDYDGGPDIGFSIPVAGVNWCMNDKVKVIDPEAENFDRVGKVVNARNWPENFQLAVTFAENDITFAHFVWYTPSQLDKLPVTDANDVELPAVVEKLPEVKNYVTDSNGCLFPWQWRHNMGWDRIPEEVRMKHQPHENHPMTEEAFRIYNAGLVSEFVVKTKQEEQ